MTYEYVLSWLIDMAILGGLSVEEAEASLVLRALAYWMWLRLKPINMEV